MLRRITAPANSDKATGYGIVNNRLVATPANSALQVLRLPSPWNISQLSVSPDGNLLAVLTAHTCHVCVLPSSAHLRSGDDSEIRLKSFQVGSTAHVLEQSPLATALWHPLSQPGVPTLVTITKDACVRQWELDINNRYTFDEPAIAIDLKKLANATTTHADFSASKYGVKKGFSPDEVEMQVAAAAFGGSGNEDENGWSSMTLWFAMTEGDTYALSPFLPSQFRAPSTLLPALTTAVVAKARAIQHDPHSLESEKRNAEAQKKWLAELDAQEPFEFPGETEFDVIEVYSRPQRLGPIPKLQGPFSLTPEPDFGEITDIHVIAPTIDREEWFGEDLEDAPLGEEGLSLGVVCLATNTGKVHVCLDLGGVEAEWLPVSRTRSYGLEDVEDGKELLVFESVDLTSTSSGATSSATFTTSPSDRYELFVTTPSGVYSLDFKPWIGDLEAELANSSDAGGEFRLDVILDSGSTLVQQPIDLSAYLKNDKTTPTAAIAIMDPSLEYFLFTTTPAGPQAATLELPSIPSHPYEPEQLMLPPPEPREPYQPPREFFTHSQIKNFLGPNPNELTRATMKGPLRFSPETLQIVTDAHRILSHETNQLGLAAADLFRRCERLRSELYDQVIKVREIAARVDAVTGDDGRDGEAAFGASAYGEVVEDEQLFGADKVDHRVIVANSNTRSLNERVERLRKKVALLGGRELSAKERAFADEVSRLQASLVQGGSQMIDPPSPSPAAPVSPDSLLHIPNSPQSPSSHNGGSIRRDKQSEGSLTARFTEIDDMQENLVKQANRAVQRLNEQEGEERKQAGGGVAAEFRKQRLQQVMAMLERETALVDAVTDRLGRLGVGL
jgi:nucleoporin NUP82